MKELDKLTFRRKMYDPGRPKIFWKTGIIPKTRTVMWNKLNCEKQEKNKPQITKVESIFRKQRDKRNSVFDILEISSQIELMIYNTGRPNIHTFRGFGSLRNNKGRIILYMWQEMIGEVITKE